jgi:hypothetical protein
MRHLQIAIVLGLLCLGSAAQAAPIAGNADQLFGSCQQLTGQRSYAIAAQVCAAAAAQYGAIAALTRNWSPYLREALALQIQARDEAMLSHHRLAFAKAVEAHRLALYLYSGFQGLDPDDYAQIRGTVTELASFESVQTAYINRNLGD